MDAVRRTLQADPNSALDEEFRDLPEDADETTRQVLAERLAPFTGSRWSSRPPHHGRSGWSGAPSVYALEALYNPAQITADQRGLKAGSPGCRTAGGVDSTVGMAASRQ